MEIDETFKRKRLFYTADDDLLLLREVVSHNPFEDRSKWSLIKTNIERAAGKDFKEKSLRDRVSLLVQKFQEKRRKDRFKFGVEEEVTELDDLLNSIVLLIQDFKTSKSRITPYEKGFQKREIASQAQAESENTLLCPFDKNLQNDEAETIEIVYVDENGEPVEKDPVLESKIEGEAGKAITTKRRSGKPERCNRILTPSRVRNGIKQTSLRYLETKNDRWYNIPCRELALEERKFELECEERKQRLKMEEDRLELEKLRLKADLDLFRNQQKLIEMALQARCGCNNH